MTEQVDGWELLLQKFHFPQNIKEAEGNGLLYFIYLVYYFFLVINFFLWNELCCTVCLYATLNMEENLFLYKRKFIFVIFFYCFPCCDSLLNANLYLQEKASLNEKEFIV